MSEQDVSAGEVRPPRGLFDLDDAPPRRVAGRVKAQAQDSRVHNRAMVLARLFHQGSLSRADLSRVTGLTAPTVSALVADLGRDGLVADVQPPAGGRRRRGQPSMLVEFQDGALSVITVDLSLSDAFRGAVMDLRGRVLARAEVALGTAFAADAEALVWELTALLTRAAPSPILGIGVACPGIVDDAGVVRQAAHLKWKDFPLARSMSERLGVPVYVANDVNVAALAVLRLGRTHAKNLVVVSTEHGVGAGLIVGGRLVEGDQFAAGEIGHVTVAPDGDPCVCGRRGCLDLFASADHLTTRLAWAAPAERGAVLAAAGDALGSVLAPIISVLNVNEVVLLGPAALVCGPLLTAASEAVRDRTLAPISGSLAVRAIADEPDLPLLGGACLVLSGELGIF